MNTTLLVGQAALNRAGEKAKGELLRQVLDIYYPSESSKAAERAPGYGKKSQKSQGRPPRRKPSAPGSLPGQNVIPGGGKIEK